MHACVSVCVAYYEDVRVEFSPIATAGCVTKSRKQRKLYRIFFSHDFFYRTFSVPHPYIQVVI